MYINPYIVGVVATILCEIVLVIGVAVWKSWRK